MTKQSAVSTQHSAISLEQSYECLSTWCREHDFAGHDPFDALNSRLFQSTPLVRSRNARLIWTQLVKRSPADLRPISAVPAQRNPKGIALFCLAHLASHRRLRDAGSETQTRSLLDDLLGMQLDGYSGAAWGYNFDWQSKNFFAPQGTATIVPTAFAARALLEAAQDFHDDEYLATARSACNFIIKDLPRTVAADNQVCFGYAPNGETKIYNASLLAAEVLAVVGALTNEVELLELSAKAARYVVKQQRAEGSWTYGTDQNQSWVDNFHTAFVLFSLKRIISACSLTGEFQEALMRGYEYWQKTFFLADGWPKYYDDNPYPADAHAGASAIVTFLELGDLDANSITNAQRVAEWTIRNLQDERGFFYYQKRRFYTVRKPYMRWSQAWMMYGLARLLEKLNADII